MLIDNTNGAPIGAIRCNGDLTVVTMPNGRVDLRGSVITGALYVLMPVKAGVFKTVAAVSDKANPVMYPRDQSFPSGVVIDVRDSRIGFRPEE